LGRRTTNPDFLTGVPELLVLRIVSRQPLHGYGIVKAIKTMSNGELGFGEGSIYPVLHRLESEKLLRTNTTDVDGRSRIVYSVTAAGKRRLEESQATWRSVVAAVETVLKGNMDEPKRKRLA